MAGNGEDPLDGLEERLRHEGPRFARAMEQGRPCRPREYRHRGAWLLLALALAVLGVGIAIGNGIVIATGLVAAGAAGHRFDPQRHRRGGAGRPPG